MRQGLCFTTHTSFCNPLYLFFFLLPFICMRRSLVASFEQKRSKKIRRKQQKGDRVRSSSLLLMLHLGGFCLNLVGFPGRLAILYLYIKDTRWIGVSCCI